VLFSFFSSREKKKPPPQRSFSRPASKLQRVGARGFACPRAVPAPLMAASAAPLHKRRWRGDMADETTRPGLCVWCHRPGSPVRSSGLVFCGWGKRQAGLGGVGTGLGGPSLRGRAGAWPTSYPTGCTSRARNPPVFTQIAFSALGLLIEISECVRR